MNALNELGQKIASFFGQPDEAHRVDPRHQMESFDFHTLSQMLPYETYDDETGIFINRNSIGFTIEMIPLVGGDESSFKILQSLFQEIMDEGSSIQCLLFADHRIDPFLKGWSQARQRSDITKETAKRRAEYFRKKEYLSPRLFKLFISYSQPIGKSLDLVYPSVIDKKDKILKILKMISFSQELSPKQLLETIGALINFNPSTEIKTRSYNPHQSLSTQINTGGKLSVHDSFLQWENEKTTKFKSYRVLDAPSFWSPGSMQTLIGDVMRDQFRIHHPFYLHYGIHCPRQSSAEGNFWRRSQIIENQGKSQTLIRMIPALADELKECDYIRRSVAQGARFVWTQLSVGIWSSPEVLPEAEQSIKSLFKINQFNLAENTCIHLPQFLAALPMTWSETAQDLKELDVLKTTISTECTSFLPLMGEWSGTPNPGMLLLGRRGQLLNWNPFDNKSGNYNISVVGRSGAGKSVFMQDLLLSGLGTGGNVYILDVGRSYEKLCEMVSGQQIEFSRTSNICLNPFTEINLSDPEERETSLTFLKSVISCMAAPNQGTSDYENALIEKAIQFAWEKNKNQATISDISEWLQSQSEDQARNLGMMLTPYTKTGIYSKYFQGKNNVCFENPFVLIELEELKDKKDLQVVILQLFIMSITNKAFLGDRSQPFYICIDEAWDLLRAKQTGPFIETLARRLRKYNGSLVIGTQSIDDFFTTPGSKAAFENSDWMCLLSQKKSSIARFGESGKVHLNESMKRALESVHTRHGEYSEVMVCDGDGNYSVARLHLDPFSQLLYSTKAEDYTKIKSLTNRGMTTTAAIEHILQSEGVK